MTNIKRVYFQCRDNPYAYQDDVVGLAEGLLELGVEVYSNCNYWLRSTSEGDYLLRRAPLVSPRDCDVYVVSYGWTRWMDSDFKSYPQEVPAEVSDPKRNYLSVYLDYEDGYETASFNSEYRCFDLVLRTKYNKKCFHPTNHIPWAMGISERIRQYTANGTPWRDRANDLLVNFNASHPYVHGTRALMAKVFEPAARRIFDINSTRDDLRIAPNDPQDLLFWNQSQSRHSRSYFERLKSSRAIAAFCGELIPPSPYYPQYLVGGRRALLSRSLHNVFQRLQNAPMRLIQWDSWRFWEGLAAGCAVFCLDLEYYGVELPVMPKNFEHYIGIRLDNVSDTIDLLQQNPGLLERIGEAGRSWALTHYSSRANASRFLASLAGRMHG